MVPHILRSRYAEASTRPSLDSFSIPGAVAQSGYCPGTESYAQEKPALVLRSLHCAKSTSIHQALRHILKPINMALGPYKDLRVDQHDRVFVITLQKAPENRINVRFAQEIIRALRDIEAELGPDSEGCVITRGNDEKFWCTGLELDESDTNPFANSDGFFPVRWTLLTIHVKRVTRVKISPTSSGYCPRSCPSVTRYADYL
jgi:hypothetical protein